MAHLKDYTLGDWLKIVSAVSAAATAGYATGGYAGLAVNIVGAIATLLATPPGKVSHLNPSGEQRELDKAFPRQ